jgi:hypothetical protein
MLIEKDPVMCWPSNECCRYSYLFCFTAWLEQPVPTVFLNTNFEGPYIHSMTTIDRGAYP